MSPLQSMDWTLYNTAESLKLLEIVLKFTNPSYTHKLDFTNVNVQLLVHFFLNHNITEV